MIKFKELISERSFNHPIEFPSVTASFEGRTLSLRFDSKDIIVNAGYSGSVNPWFASLCFLILNKSLSEVLALNWQSWEDNFRDDQLFWDLRQEQQDHFINAPLELLKAAVDIFRGREYLYQDVSPLVCRCFGVREADVLEHLQQEARPTLETLASATKAGMGCRSCVPQLKRWLLLGDEKKRGHHFKARPIVDWLVQIDYQLKRFPHAQDWKMELQGMKDGRVSISFDKTVSQKEEEAMGRELQDFLGRAVDLDLAFFLRAARHFSKARG